MGQEGVPISCIHVQQQAMTHTGATKPHRYTLTDTQCQIERQLDRKIERQTEAQIDR